MIVDVRTRSGCCTALLENLPSIDLDQDIAAISVGRMPSMLCLFLFFYYMMCSGGANGYADPKLATVVEQAR
ncbi:hypothetical protein ULG90_20590 [Halopseudomonas pachastrellae]|nr:hypothetical protein ULG90_20590 [Halopseudomonas pachastrellae]